MPYAVEVVEGAEYVKVVFWDEMSKEDHEAGRDAAARALTDSGFNQLLVDARTVNARMSLLDDFEFTQDHQSSPIALARIAVVYREEERERFRFIETVSVNRGGNMKVFTDPEAAVRWLTGSG